MRIRHRVPSVFNLSMVDVMCCALGCVILLWLVNLREAWEEKARAGSLEKETGALKSEASGLQKEADKLRSVVSGLQTESARLKSELDKVIDQWLDLHGNLLEAQAEIRSADAKLQMTQEARDKALAQLVELNKKLTASAQRASVLEKEVRDKSTLLTASTGRVKDTEKLLSEAEARLKDLQPLADLVPGLRADVKSYRDKLAREEALAKALEKEIARRMLELGDAGKSLENLEANKKLLLRDIDARDKELALARAYREKYAAAEARLSILEKELADKKQELTAAQTGIQALQGERKSLVNDVNKARAAVENRFAGIALTGRRVIFLVDMSGSMDLVDEHTAAPEKWLGVRETVAKIMGTLPDLEKFQVILFSEKASYLVGTGEEWLDYDPKNSADRVLLALAAIRPKGGTDMYAGLETAFRFRPVGLDTIYLLSDGLPNLGEGLTPEIARTLKETDKADILSRYIRNKLKNEWNPEIKGRPRVRINAVGFFYESPDVGAFLWALARENDGSFVGMSKP